jgi:hypothetical protein
MYPPIFSVAAADAGVTAVLGSNPTRLYPFGEASQGVASPYAVWQVVTGSPENYLAERPDLDSYTVQIDIYGDTGAQVIAAATAVRDAIELEAYIVRWGGQTKDPTTGRYRISFDSDWHTPR